MQAGASNGYISDAAIQLGVTIELSEGADVEQKNGCGAICKALKQPDKIKRVTLAMELCDLDAELIQLMSGGTVLTDPAATDDVKGYKLPLNSAATVYGCLEAFSHAWDDESQLLLGGVAQYFDFVFPLSTFTTGQFTLESENFLKWPLNGFSIENPNMTNKGPFDDWPLWVSVAGGADAAGNYFLTPTLPTAVCGYTTVAAQTS